MADFDHLSLLSALSKSDSVDARVTALHAIQNHVTGHELRKIAYIRSGIIPELSRILNHDQESLSGALAELKEDRLWIQSANIVGSLAYGGPTFVQPILHSTIIASLLARHSSTSNPRLQLAILWCLNVIADNLPLSSPDDWTPDRRLPALLYTYTNVACFTKSVAQASYPKITQQICDAVLALVCKTCTEERYKALLVRSGMLAALGERMASFVVAEGLVIPGLDAHGIDFEERGPLPDPAPSNARLSPVLETVGLLIESSKAYAIQLVAHPAIVAVLPSGGDDFSSTDIKKSPWGATYFSGGAVPRSKTQTPLDLLLPRIPDLDRTDANEGFPPLGSNSVPPKRRTSSIRPTSELPTGPIVEDAVEEQEESLLVPWLLYVIRTHRGRKRVLAIKVLVDIFSHDLVTTIRTRSFKTLVVPLLVRDLDPKIVPGNNEYSTLLTKVPYSDVVPRILAKLIGDDESLQKIAVDGRAINRLASCLKLTFDPISERASLWRPSKQTQAMQGESIDCCLGPGGPSLRERHIMANREGLLQALAAIAPFNDHYRKEICDQGVLAQIMLALEPFHSEAKVDEGEDPAMVTSGNSSSTLLAACDIVRALTRSVTALRTKLVDADIGKAIVKLLHSPDPEVAIAATKVIANLAIDFSPMKPSISEPALVKKLCEQAHSANARLRLESIWALKHLVLKSSNKLKRDVIDELGSNWIRHLIATDPYDIPPGEVIGLVEKDYPPRSDPYSGTGDIIMSEDSEEDEAVTIEAIRNKSDYVKHTIEDDLEIQEKLLDLLRNLFCGDSSSEIVEYVLSEVGYQEFVKIIMDRLRSRTTAGATRKANQMFSAPPGIVTATLNIVVHLAACQPKFRNMISSNPVLMRQILSFHQSPNRNIRTAVCWIAINLIYGDNPQEREACRARAFEMNRIGFLSHMKRLESDSESNVRERAKTAVLLLEKLIPKDLQR